LGSGGARGLTQIGAIEELENQGYTITSISGASMGAVVGGIYAAGHLPEFKKWMCNLDRLGVYGLMDFTLTTQGFIKGDKVFNEIKKFVNRQNIEDLKIPFVAVAVDIASGKQKVFDSGDLFSAIRASVAIPSVLTPVYLEDAVLVDGGVMNPLPMDVVKRHKSDVLVAIDLNGSGQYKSKKQLNKERQKELKQEKSRWEKALSSVFSDFLKSSDKSDKKKKHNYFDILNGSFDLMQSRFTEVLLKEHKPEILISIPKSAGDTFDFFRAEELIEFGRRQAKAAIEKYESK
jgi:NTE family protein